MAASLPTNSTDTDPFVQIRLSDLLALRAAAANTNAVAHAEPSAPEQKPLLRAPAPGPAPEYLTTKEAAALLGVSPKGLEAMRARGDGPPFIRVGRAVRYLACELAQRKAG